VRLYRKVIWNRSIQAGGPRVFWSGIPADCPVAEARSLAAWKMTQPNPAMKRRSVLFESIQDYAIRDAS
jgi:hypothetical protein